MNSRFKMGAATPAAYRSRLGILSESEVAWIEFIRLISDDTDPMPTLKRVQGLRAVLHAP